MGDNLMSQTMRARKIPRDAETPSPTGVSSPQSHKKPRSSRVRLTHLEVRCGDALRLRIAVADDTMAEVGNELGALISRMSTTRASTKNERQPLSTEPTTVSRLNPDELPNIKKIALDTRTSVIEAPQPEEFLISRQHVGDDDTYHAGLREHLVELIGSLCDTSLADALEIARTERARRAEGGN